MKMPRNMAFVLINTEMGFEDAVLSELRKMSDVTEAYPVYGVYDIIAKVETDSKDELKVTVTESIKRLNNVRSALTMMGV